ncbi:2-phospho-L-lactate transferase (plasmid) [Paraburkholderia sprentiae WSM5005]|uniref:2-phospho-L-lactate transferase n=1 Tax=Paraburkholderia sprentiae WSM5005 TaxID=754502 RepID=A0A1I9YW99_9BURK|nr:2-phospho-L-lactate transferase [Paraburkholderia sprentiae]APA90504.1 2-phospho-L-lactate transferase [Paraburkholderia sprentiae WSM5005]
MSRAGRRITCITGGVGGAKLVLGLQQVLPPGNITAIVNTGDDFRHLGFWVSPDIDTLLYTLSGKSNVAQGWGREGESWAFMAALRELGGEDWFQLGDGDLALHVLRSLALASGKTLSAVTGGFARRWGIGVTVLPMSDDSIATVVNTEEGELPFQRYFVERRCEPRVSAIRFDGASRASPAPGVVEAIRGADMVLIAPSNPFLSVDPILAIPAIRTALEGRSAPVVAVSPLVGGRAVKGPTAKLMEELGISVHNDSIAAHYEGLVDGLLIDSGDGCNDEAIRIARTSTLMNSMADKARVARAAMQLAEELAT